MNKIAIELCIYITPSLKFDHFEKMLHKNPLWLITWSNVLAQLMRAPTGCVSWRDSFSPFNSCSFGLRASSWKSDGREREMMKSLWKLRGYNFTNLLTKLTYSWWWEPHTNIFKHKSEVLQLFGIDFQIRLSALLTRWVKLFQRNIPWWKTEWPHLAFPWYSLDVQDMGWQR